MRSLEDCRLYGFIDEAYRQGRSYEALAKALCNGGVDIIQLRMKEASLESILKAALIIQPITSAAGVHLVINDELDGHCIYYPNLDGNEYFLAPLT